jgi:hypothetical protein
MFCFLPYKIPCGIKWDDIGNIFEQIIEENQVVCTVR